MQLRLHNWSRLVMKNRGYFSTIDFYHRGDSVRCHRQPPLLLRPRGWCHGAFTSVLPGHPLSTRLQGWF